MFLLGNDPSLKQQNPAVSEFVPLVEVRGAVAQDVGDFNGDGNSDILWRHDSGQVYLWEMDGLQVKDEGAVAHAADRSDWHVL